MANTKGPWSLTCADPVRHRRRGRRRRQRPAGARAVGRAAKQYFAGGVPTPLGELIVEEIDEETELLDPEPGHHSPPPSIRGTTGDDDIVDAVIVDAETRRLTDRTDDPDRAVGAEVPGDRVATCLRSRQPSSTDRT